MAETAAMIGKDEQSGARFLIPGLVSFYKASDPISYALLRLAFGLTIMTHGIPKLTGSAQGSIADRTAGSINLIGNVLHVPFAPQLAMAVALLEAFGGFAVVLGLGTRVFAPMLSVQMLMICAALWPTASSSCWTDVCA
jgi:putative oxidoreductase